MKKPSAIGFLDIAAGIIGGGTFLIFTFIINSPFIGIVAGLASFGGMILLTNKSKPKGELDIQIEGITHEMIKETIDEGNKKLTAIRSYIPEIKNSTVKIKVQNISEITEKILNQIKKKPKCLRAAKRFLSYYLEAVDKILYKYTEIAAQDVKTEEVKESLKKVESLLDTIILTFEKQMGKLLENDIMDLDAEISLLENTIKMEGL